jgi:hypothetical protein
MKALIRSFEFILVALLLALPVIGGGGGGGGDSGVWVLPGPGPGFCQSGPVPAGTDARSVLNVGEGLLPVTLRVAVEMGVPTVSFATPALAGINEFTISGHDVTISPNVFTAMRRAGVGRGDLVVMDGNRRGYVITILFTSAGIQLLAY